MRRVALVGVLSAAYAWLLWSYGAPASGGAADRWAKLLVTPSESGRLTLICNEGGHADRAGNSGAMSVLIEPASR